MGEMVARMMKREGGSAMAIFAPKGGGRGEGWQPWRWHERRSWGRRWKDGEMAEMGEMMPMVADSLNGGEGWAARRKGDLRTERKEGRAARDGWTDGGWLLGEEGGPQHLGLIWMEEEQRGLRRCDGELGQRSLGWLPWWTGEDEGGWCLRWAASDGGKKGGSAAMGGLEGDGDEVGDGKMEMAALEQRGGRKEAWPWRPAMDQAVGIEGDG